MRNLSITLLIVALLSATAFSRVSADESALAGIWVNTNEGTRACAKFEISFDDEGSASASFVWWGKTSPKDSRYGPFPLSISGNGNSAIAEHITTFSEMQFTVMLRGSKAILKMATKYTDDSGRDDFELEEKFEKKL